MLVQRVGTHNVSSSIRTCSSTCRQYANTHRGGSIQSENAAAFANSTRSLAAEATALEDATALVEGERVLTVAAAPWEHTTAFKIAQHFRTLQYFRRIVQ
jgi:hypothetical protein